MRFVILFLSLVFWLPAYGSSIFKSGNSFCAEMLAGFPERQTQYIQRAQGWLKDVTHAKLSAPSATPEIRLERLKQLSVDENKFWDLTDKELEIQWGGQHLRLHEDPEFMNFSSPLSLGRGSKVAIRRFTKLNDQELKELYLTGQHTSHFLASYGYDRKAATQMAKELDVDTYLAILFQRIGGYFGLSTAYAVREEMKPILTPNWTTLQARLMGNERVFQIVLEYEIPVEAIVRIGPQGIPPHVLANPEGFAFIMEAGSQESEVTFLDFIPRQWLKTPLQRVQYLHENNVINQR